MSRVAWIIAGIYFTIATGISVCEMISPPTGGWISLGYIGTFLATFPASAPLGMLGIEPSLDNKLTVAALLAASTAIVYRIVDLIVWFFTSK